MASETPTPPYLVEVTCIQDVTPNLRRITFGSADLSHYPAVVAAHVKLFFPQKGQTQPDLPTFNGQGPVWASDAQRPIIRTYSLRSVRPQQAEVDIEFALHKHHGPAVSFARRAQLGDKIGLSHPGGPKPILPPADFYCMAGDPSSLPAIAALLEHLPSEHSGVAYIRVDAVEDVIELKKPHAFQVNWIIGDLTTTSELITQFCSQPLIKENTFFWLAGENHLVVTLRRYLRQVKQCPRDKLYAIPYWRDGINEEKYHHQRHEIMDDIDG